MARRERAKNPKPNVGRQNTTQKTTKKKGFSNTIHTETGVIKEIRSEY